MVKKRKLKRRLFEDNMKKRGEKRVKKTIFTKNGNLKQVSGTQEGQNLIYEDAHKIVHKVQEWIDNKSAVFYRDELKKYFFDEDFLIQKIMECMLFMAGSIHSEDYLKNGVKKTRHKKINTIKEKILTELSFDNVWRFIEVVVSESRYFEVQQKVEFNSKGGFSSVVRYSCSLSEKILDDLNTLAVKSFYPMAIEEKPLDWHIDKNGDIRGGYHTFQYEMVRMRGKGVDYSKFSDNIFEVLNYIQSVPWIVNEEVFNVIKSDIKEPLKADFMKNEFPNADASRWDVDLKSDSLSLSKEDIKKIEEARKVYQDGSALYNADLSDYQSALGKYRYLKLALDITEDYIGKTIYFPHNYDFRGRVYPMAIGLSPQGNDAVKSLLLYKNVKPLTPMGLKWAWAYLASLYGDDKITFEQRVLRGKELINVDYKEADEPYQFLSHQLELQKYLKDNSYVPNIRIHLDACNSGSQFTSAITKDVRGCMATNVIPMRDENGVQLRQDAYMLVAEKSIELAKEMFEKSDDLERKNTIGFLQSLLEKDGRKICKKPVMVSNYGGTAGGRAKILWLMLRELGVNRKWVTQEVASLFSHIIGSSITGVLNGGKAFEIYIQKMNNVIASNNVPIHWSTEDGFFVTHSKNKELKPRSIRCMIPNARRVVSITQKKYSKDLSVSKMRSAISPNYIHSLDAELLRRTALKMYDEGIMDTDWIHDSFGCHPNDIELLLMHTKETFIEMMDSEPLVELDRQLREQCVKTRKTNKELNMIKVPNLDDGNFTLEGVLSSEWFFS